VKSDDLLGAKTKNLGFFPGRVVKDSDNCSLRKDKKCP